MSLSRRDAVSAIFSPCVATVAGVMPSTTADAARSQGLNDGTKPVINVRQLGAAGDGVHDDSPAFSQAIAAASRSAPSVIYVPAGRYLVASLKASGHTIQVQGDGASSALITKGPAPLLMFTNVGSVMMEDLTLSGQKSVEGGDYALLTAQDCSAIELINVAIRDSGGDGAHVRGSDTVRIDSCSFENCSRFGLRVTDTPTLGNRREIVRCLVRGNESHGILLQRFMGADVESNFVLENHAQGIHATDGSDWLRVCNNRCTKNGSRPIEHGIYILRCRGVAVHGNASFENAGDGVLLRECNDSIVSTNICTDNHRHGVSVQRIDDPRSDTLIAAVNVGARNAESGVIATGISRSLLGLNVGTDNGRYGVGGYPGPLGATSVLGLSCNLVSDNAKGGVVIAGATSAAALANLVKTPAGAPALALHDFEKYQVAQVRLAANVEVSGEPPTSVRDLKGQANLVEHMTSDAPIR